MVQAHLNAMELAAKLNYYLCPPGVYYDFMHDRLKLRRFGEVRVLARVLLCLPSSTPEAPDLRLKWLT